MHVRPVSQLLEKVRHAHAERSVLEHPVVRARKGTASVLTAFTLLLGIVIGANWGVDGLACYLPWLPFSLILLWRSVTELRFDERAESERRTLEIAPTPVELLEERRSHATLPSV